MQEKISCVTSENENIYLNTFMTSSEFARAKFSDKLKESGVLAKKIDDVWNFQTWTFEETFENQNQNVILKGKAFSGKTLKTYFEILDSLSSENSSATYSEDKTQSENSPNQSEKILQEKAKSVAAAALVVNVIEEAINWKQEIPELGGGGIFISDDFSQILFMPKMFFLSSILCCKENIFMQEHGFYVNENLTKVRALKFIQASIAYKTLSQKFPFENPDRKMRALDILDKNFVFPQIQIPGLNDDVAISIILGLIQDATKFPAQNPQEESSKSKKKSALPKDLQTSQTLHFARGTSLHFARGTSLHFARGTSLHFPRTEFFEECGLNPQGNLPENQKLNFVDRSSKINQKEFEKFSKRSSKKQEARVESKRWFRKHRTILISICTVLVVGIFTGIFFFASSQDKPSSKGLTSFQTLEMFYSAMNTLDVDQALECTSGKEMKNFTGVLSNLYVSFKARAMYNQSLQAQSLSKWLCLNQPLSNLAGLSQVKIFADDVSAELSDDELSSEKIDDKKIDDEQISGKQAKLFFKAPRKNQHLKPLLQENEQNLNDGDKKNYKVNFYTILTEDQTQITLTFICDQVELTYKKNRWLITSINRQTLSEEKLSKEDFVNDYAAAVEQNGKNINAIMQNLEQKYSWLPTNAELQEAIDALSEEVLF